MDVLLYEINPGRGGVLRNNTNRAVIKLIITRLIRILDSDWLITAFVRMTDGCYGLHPYQKRQNNV